MRTSRSALSQERTVAFPSFYMLAMLALGAVLVERGETQFTNIFTVVMGVFMCAQFVGIRIVYTPSVVLVQRAAKNIFGIINLPSEDDAARAIKKEGHNGDIAFTNVSFKYPTRPDVPILKDVSFGHVPLSSQDPGRMLRSLRSYRLLEGYRGSAKANIEQFRQILMQVNQLLLDFPAICEMDMNPLIFDETRGAFYAVDARIKIS